MKILNLISFFLYGISCFSQESFQKLIENKSYTLSCKKANIESLSYTLKGSNVSTSLSLPTVEINGKLRKISLRRLVQKNKNIKLSNGALEIVFEGEILALPAAKLQMVFQMSAENSILRFKYNFLTGDSLKLTKTHKKDQISYFSFLSPEAKIKEIRMSEFNEKFHATHLTEMVLDRRYFENEASFMGPLAVIKKSNGHFVFSYEHGSQYPDRFLEFKLRSNNTVSLEAVKGNYLAAQPVQGFSSVWFDIGGILGSEDALAAEFRTFVLKYLSQNTESRKPYIFYNTWGRQERTNWAGAKYLSSMNLDWTLKEIDKAHEMGIEVYVLDAGWYSKTGDWELNKTFFPDELKQVKAKLDAYNMKLGLWFNPTVAALSSDMLKRNRANEMSFNGKKGEPFPIWETENSVGMCLVSPYWEDFADKLIDLTKKYGVSYFKWDAVGQYGCNDPNHFHGTAVDSPEERSQRYAFLQAEYMTKIIDKVSKVKKEVIFDFDITEDGRCVGLQFLSSGKYFIINNGPYYHSFDLAEKWKSVNPNGNANLLVAPGPARGWFTRSVLDYDKWLPSILFLTHYQPDEPRNSQIINVASLILGQNGIWGEILKTSKEGTLFIADMLKKYKLLRNEISQAQVIISGQTGGSPEIYEKIDPKTGKGCIVVFANAGGQYSYISHTKTHEKFWSTEGVKIEKNKNGSSSIHCDFSEPSAKIIFFGTE
jgi:alpha-galactosidase